MDGAVTRVAEEVEGLAARDEGEEVREGELAREEDGGEVSGAAEVRAAASRFSLECHARKVTVVVSFRGAEESFLKSKKVLMGW